MGIDLEGRWFRAIDNSANAEVGGETSFHYHQQGDLVWARYEGGSIRHGHLLAVLTPAGELDMRYHHVNAAGSLMTGVCRSRIEVLPDGRYRLHERWHWTSGDLSEGESVLEEVKGELNEGGQLESPRAIPKS